MEKSTLILGILIGAVCMYFLIHLLWRMGYYTFCFLLNFIRRSQNPSGNRPGRRSSLEPMVLPQIRKDLPNFDSDSIKQQAESYIVSHYPGHKDFKILKIDLSGYRKEGAKQKILLEASVCWQEKNPVYRLLTLCMEASFTASDTCMGCGGSLKPGDRHCRNCGRKVEKFASPWAVTNLKEQ